MFIELVDQLRCPRAHVATWLVASIDRARDRDILEGTLGCPVCATQYPIRDGAADLRVPERREMSDAGASVRPEPSPDDALRLAAFMDLVEPGGFVVVAGEWGDLAPLLTRLIDGVHALAVNPGSTSLAGVAGVSALLAADGLPIRAGAARGIAVDERHATPAHLADAIAALRAGGRIVAPASTPMTDALTMLARDDRHWVAERNATVSAPVALRRSERL